MTISATSHVPSPPANSAPASPTSPAPPSSRYATSRDSYTLLERVWQQIHRTRTLDPNAYSPIDHPGEAAAISKAEWAAAEQEVRSANQRDRGAGRLSIRDPGRWFTEHGIFPLNIVNDPLLRYKVLSNITLSANPDVQHLPWDDVPTVLAAQLDTGNDRAPREAVIVAATPLVIDAMFSRLDLPALRIDRSPAFSFFDPSSLTPDPDRSILWTDRLVDRVAFPARWISSQLDYGLLDLHNDIFIAVENKRDDTQMVTARNQAAIYAAHAHTASTSPTRRTFTAVVYGTQVTNDLFGVGVELWEIPPHHPQAPLVTDLTRCIPRGHTIFVPPRRRLTF